MVYLSCSPTVKSPFSSRPDRTAHSSSPSQWDREDPHPFMGCISVPSSAIHIFRSVFRWFSMVMTIGLWFFLWFSCGFWWWWNQPIIPCDSWLARFAPLRHLLHAWSLCLGFLLTWRWCHGISPRKKWVQWDLSMKNGDLIRLSKKNGDLRGWSKKLEVISWI